MMNALIVDDEKNGRENLRHLLVKYCPQVNILDEADSVSSALKKIEKYSIQLLFLDIEMPDGNGFGLLEKIERINFETIFVTAYDQYAIKAFRFSAVDYLLKPIKVAELKDAVDKAAQRIKTPQKEHVHTLLQNIQQTDQQKKISLPQLGGHCIIKLNEIVRCQSDNNYTWFFFNHGKKLLVTRTLKEYDELLCEDGFYRVHQSHMINIHHIKEHERGANAGFLMSDGTKVPVSQRRKGMVNAILSKMPR